MLRLSCLPELGCLWLHGALETSAADTQAALQRVVSCFPVHIRSPASAILGEQELLLELLRRQLQMEDDACESQCSSALVTQLAVAVVSYCSEQLQPQVELTQRTTAHALIPSHGVRRTLW